MQEIFKWTVADSDSDVVRKVDNIQRAIENLEDATVETQGAFEEFSNSASELYGAFNELFMQDGAMDAVQAGSAVLAASIAVMSIY